LTDVPLLPRSPLSRNYRHGYKTAGKYSPEYSIWMNMRSRCNNPKNNRFATYGARGIAVCRRWEVDFLNFLTDMGRRPSPKHTLERIDNDQGYFPENCRWATRKEQARNRRSSRFLEFDGQTRTSAEWSELTGISQGTLHARLKAGWPVERALSEPVQGKARKDEKSDMKPARIYSRLPLEDTSCKP
jgi:hypothetical protein